MVHHLFCLLIFCVVHVRFLFEGKEMADEYGVNEVNVCLSYKVYIVSCSFVKQVISLLFTIAH